MRTSRKWRAFAGRDDLLETEASAEDEGAQSELEHGGASTPLEADEPERERSHPDETPDPADGFR